MTNYMPACTATDWQTMPSIHPLIIRCFQEAGIDTSSLTSPGGNIVVDGNGSKWFCKTGRNVSQMRGEVEGLKHMGITSPDLVPTVAGFVVSETEQEAATVSQYYDLSSARGAHVQQELARKFATMHQVPLEGHGIEGYPGKYGFHVPTHCGVTEQDNTWEESWEVFFRDRRLGELVKRIGDKSISSEWERMKARVVPLLLHSFEPPPKPVICHGDLWSGNVGLDETTKQPVIYDPASYYGHNEADLGITHMFGGFSQDFYDEYHKHHPRSSPFYEERQKLYELYHHLNHTLMFGGGYKPGTLSIMRSLISWAETQAPR